MTVAIHQPNFLPWIGYFYKIAQVETFIFLDDVQFTKNGFTNRNRIVTSQGEQWITLPVIQSGKSLQSINEVLIFDSERSVSKILKTIETNYRKSQYYVEIISVLKPFFENIEDASLSRMNQGLLTAICDKLKFDTKILKSSDIKNLTGESTERLISICNSLGADTYLSGFGGDKYQELDLYKENGIKLTYTAFSHPVYKQLGKLDFIPNMSILDYLFCVGLEEAKLFFNK